MYLMHWRSYRPSGLTTTAGSSVAYEWQVVGMLDGYLGRGGDDRAEMGRGGDDVIPLKVHNVFPKVTFAHWLHPMKI